MNRKLPPSGAKLCFHTILTLEPPFPELFDKDTARESVGRWFESNPGIRPGTSKCVHRASTLRAIAPRTLPRCRCCLRRSRQMP